jgi:small redox-active disulfide protein 2
MNHIKIEIIGPGCPFCKKLFKNVSEVVAEKGIHSEVTHITEFKQVIRFIPFTPVLRINGEVVHRGKLLPSKKKLAAILKEKIK